MKKALVVTTKSSKEDHTTQDNKSIQIQVKKPQLSLLRKGPKFIPTTKGDVLNSKSDIFNLLTRLQLEEILHEK